ncbi:ligase [Marinobacterium nitratireducens]|uniref:Ligase n=1 Tax=Marinobacterium nitratireducens TaxID=518897 RepID=A0A917Z8K4_9GAMM|nr:Wzy polymerase domain-containing protein [Marinobacterium nitratireducens]GGO75893.1 ligase [Marinobacterium nitratireducens]
MSRKHKRRKNRHRSKPGTFTLKLERNPELERSHKLFFLLFGLLFLAAPLYYQQNLGGEGLYLPYNASTWSAALLLIGAGWLYVFRRGTLDMPRYWPALAALPAGLVISGFVTGVANPTEWLIRLGYVLGGFMLLLALFQFRLNRHHRDIALIVIFCGILLQALIGWIQIQQLPLLKELLPVSSGKRPIAMFQQVNLTASYLATGLPLAIYLATRPGALNARLMVRLLPYFGLVVCTGVLLSCGSRVGLLGGGLGLLLALAARFRFLLNHRRIALGLALSLALGGAFLLSEKVERGSSAALSKIERLQEGGIADVRFSVYAISFETIANAPLFGHGIGSFQSVWQDQRGHYQDSHPEAKLGPRYSHPHNELLFWLVEGGIVALAGILVCALAVLWQLVRLGPQRGLLLAGTLIPITLHTQVELPFYISSPHWFLLLFLLYVTFSQGTRRYTLRLSQAARGLCTALLILVPAGASTFLLQSLVANSGIVSYMKSRGQQPAYLEPAINNLFFSGPATYLQMKNTLIAGYSLDSKANSQLFADWANEYLKQTPDIQLYYDLAGAYVHLGERDKARATLAEGLRIYRHNGKLENAMKALESGQIDAYLRQLAEKYAERLKANASQAQQ